MNTNRLVCSRSSLLLAAIGTFALLSGVARAGDVYLTGHDVDFHSGQNGYDGVILDYLRGSTPKASYSIAVVGSASTGTIRFTGGSGSASSLGYGGAIPLVGTLAGYASAKFYDAEALAADPNRATILAGVGALVVASYTGCGGCSLTSAGSAALNGMSADIATAFNAGMDIYGNSGDGLATYYGFLPASAVATGAAISGSTGFTATAAGLAIGITDVSGSSMINGHQTHNRFTSQAAAFTTFEVRGSEIVSIGLRDGRITDGGITTGGSVPDSGATAILLAAVLPLLGFLRRKVRS